MSDYDPILQDLERESLAGRQRVRELLIAENRLDVLAEYDKKMREVDLGIAGAQGAWHALSPAQHRVLTMAANPSGKFYRTSRTRYDYHGEPHAVADVCGVPTMRNLIARELMACDGGAFDPEKKVAITERGRFVLKHGPV